MLWAMQSECDFSARLRLGCLGKKKDTVAIDWIDRSHGKRYLCRRAALVVRMDMALEVVQVLEKWKETTM